MILELKPVFLSEGESLAVNCELDLGKLEFSGAFPLKNPISVVGSVSNRAGIVTVSVMCSVEYSAPCDRCGRDVKTSYRIPVERVLVSQRADETDDELIEVPDMNLDIDELCTSEIILALPMKHLCKDDCKGICPTCGKDLNSGNCGCGKKSVDSRLESLAQLLD